MAISINYATFVIFIPRADLLVLQTTPSFVYQLNLESFYREVMDLQDDQAGSPFPTAINNTAPVSIGGVTLARVIEIINGYTVEFEDGKYAVNLSGANTNLQDVAIVNQVSIRPNNSAGLQDLSVLLQAAYGGVVNVDVINGQTGTQVPLGTRGLPVNNFGDALIIAQRNSLSGIHLLRSATLSSGDFSAGYTFSSDSPAITTITIEDGADVIGCTFRDLTVQGLLDGGSTFRNCLLLDVDYATGFIYDCALGGTISLQGDSQCTILDCWSNVAGGGPLQYPVIDMGGNGNSLALRNYSGGLGIENYSSGGSISLDMSSGRVTFAPTVTAGTITVRGIADVEDNSTGTAVIIDATLNESLVEINEGVANIGNIDLSGANISVNAPTAVEIREEMDSNSTRLVSISTDTVSINNNVTLLSDDVSTVNTNIISVDDKLDNVVITLGNVDSNVTTLGVQVANAQVDITQIKNDVANLSFTGGGLTVTQATMLLEMYELLGLDPTKPLVVTETARTAGNIDQTIATTSTSTTVSRN